MSVRILHFADAHIDMANYGRHDPQSGLPMRVLDFLKSLDTIVETAIQEKVDLVLFAGDAFKDRTPAPTFQREWGLRIMRLSKEGIPSVLLVGNHDLSPALGRAHALEGFETFEVPNVLVVDKPVFLTPEDLGGLKLQIAAFPWVSRSGLAAYLGLSGLTLKDLYDQLAQRLLELLHEWLDEIADPDLPTILMAHGSVQGAQYGGERSVMLGGDLILPPALVKDSRLDYAALGHIHKAQDLNKGLHPPVIYPGSIERVDFGEAGDDKFFVIAEVARGDTQVHWHRLEGVRPFIDRSLTLEDDKNITAQIKAVLPHPEEMRGAILRLILEYPRDWESLIDEAALRDYTAECFEFHLVKRPQVKVRVRLPENQTLGELSAMDLLTLYWRASHLDENLEELNNLAAQVMRAVEEQPD